jgi:hypothetical protein
VLVFRGMLNGLKQVAERNATAARAT